MTTTVRPMREEDRERIREITQQSFALPKHRLEMHVSTPLEEARVVEVDGRVQGVMRLERVGQLLGGRSVPSAAVSLVQVAADLRGQGLGTILLREALAEAWAHGVALSTLYPSTVGVYRAAGYEFAGAWTRYRVPMAVIPRGRNVAEVESWDAAALGEIRGCYQRLAQSSPGMVDRTERWWHRRVLAAAPDQAVHRYLVRRGGEVTGYMIYTHEPEASSLPYTFALVCRDLVWHDPESLAALLRVAAGHPVMGLGLTWVGPVEEPLAAFVDLEEIKTQDCAHWMSRLLHVTRALELRGYPPDVEGAIDLSVSDLLLPDNETSFRLEVKDGVGRVTSGRDARVRVDIGALTAMYTGWWPARVAARTGRLHGVTAREIEVLESMFAGPKPWMFDRF